MTIHQLQPSEDLAARMRAELKSYLSRDTGLAYALGGSGRVYDDVPAAVPLPYVTMGVAALDAVARLTPADMFASTLNVWCRGHRRAHELSGLVVSTLDDWPCDVGGYRLPFRFILADIRRVSDGDIFCSTIKFRAELQKAGAPRSGAA